MTAEERSSAVFVAPSEIFFLRKRVSSFFAQPAKSPRKSEKKFTRCGADHSAPAMRRA
jgi:hypothetical protein